MRVYLDTAPIIYLVENVTPYKGILLQQLSVTETTLVISDLSRLECRVKPMRDDNQDLLAGYEQFFNNAIHHTVTLASEVIDLATDIRARFGFTTPDAIHLAAATWANCDSFLTNDYALQKFHQIKVVVVR